jgi:S-adenosylmethionine/arginine decarboxylase-like enzyme
MVLEMIFEKAANSKKTHSFLIKKPKDYENQSVSVVIVVQNTHINTVSATNRVLAEW